jgi:hypothetical protein
MHMRRDDSKQWAKAAFGSAELGDRRRLNRLMAIAAAASGRPDGRISEVFQDAGEMHGAYDFVESPHVPVSELVAAMGRGTLRGREGDDVLVPVDGSSLTFTDRQRSKGFGVLGSGERKSTGMKVITALGVSSTGMTLGVLGQVWWARPKARKKSPAQRAKRKPEDKETRYWVEAFQQAHAQCTARGVRPWFVVDREGDARPLLLALSKLEGARFTVRSSWDRVVESTGKDRQYLRATLAKEEPLCVYSLEVPAGSNRQARTARMELRAQRVKVRLRDKWTKKIEWLEMSAVWAREVGTAPKGERALDWLLYTNTVVDGAESARSIVNGYATRWRIEEFHKTWKTGACNAERMQLRSSEAAMRWAIILAAVATRIERLKYKARTTPNAAATDELGRDEVKMLVALAPGMKKRAEKAPDESLTIGEAVHWIARIGGYTGTSSGGPPGSITIGRGLERLGYAVDGARAAGIFR